MHYQQRCFNNGLGRDKKFFLPGRYALVYRGLAACVHGYTWSNFSPRCNPKSLARVVQKMDSAIHRINHYPADKYLGNQLHYPVDRDLSGGYRYPPFEQPRPGVLVLKFRPCALLEFQ